MAAIVEIADGQIQGTVETLSSGDTFYSFKGIPYAKPPIGDLRFRDPEPPIPWSGVRDASKHGPMCPQFNTMLPNESIYDEDCLYLNVYTRTTNVHSKAPVMFWIHGGAFVMGSGNSDVYGPDYLLQKNVVLVTINYRLEAFGFLCLENADVPGNAGMKDQVAALKWTRANIEKFGGDPEDITIFGESAGAASVALLLVSPMAKGLFSKAIIQSGSNLADWNYRLEGKEIAFKVGKLLGKETENDEELVSFLRSLPASDLVNISAKFKDLTPRVIMPFNPVVEKDVAGTEAFLFQEPIEHIMSRDYSDVPVIIGVTNGEGVLTVGESIQNSEELNARKDLGVTRELKRKLTPEEIEELGNEIKTFYFGNKNIGVETLLELIEFDSDYIFNYPAVRLASLLSKQGSSTVYLYCYTLVDDENFLNKMFKGSYADKLKHLACHAADLTSLFENTANKISDDPDDPSRSTMRNMTTLWTNFAKKGCPTPDKTLGEKWERFTPELKSYLEINAHLSAKVNLFEKRMQFWDNIFEKHGLPF